jgi:hypothetical protein
MKEINIPVNNKATPTILNDDVRRTKKFSWSAVIAGVIAALSAQLVLNLLGVGIGANSFNIDAGDVTGPSMLSVGWILASGIVVMFIGGWVAGSISYYRDALRNAVVGGVVWGIATLITFCVTFSAAGVMLNNTLNMTKQGIALVGEGAAKGASTLAQAAPQVSATAKNLFPDITQLQKQLVKQAEEVFDQEKVKAVVNNPGVLKDLKAELKEMILTFMTAEGDDAQNAAKEKILSFLTQKLGMEKEQAEELMNAWSNKYAQLKEQVKDEANKAKDKVAATAEKTINVLGKAALITALAFIASALAAMIGAVAGAGRKSSNYNY